MWPQPVWAGTQHRLLACNEHNNYSGRGERVRARQSLKNKGLFGRIIHLVPAVGGRQQIRRKHYLSGQVQDK